ncbi:MAG: transposase [Roseovarius sp.]|nr:transposase [Roseovarius sp.]
MRLGGLREPAIRPAPGGGPPPQVPRTPGQPHGSGYRSQAWRDACTATGLRHLTTRPYRPQTNGKAERFIQMLQRQWAYAVAYANSQNRPRSLLPAWLHYYNHHRPHGSLDRTTPGQRLHALANPNGIYN